VTSFEAVLPKLSDRLVADMVDLESFCLASPVLKIATTVRTGTTSTAIKIAIATTLLRKPVNKSVSKNAHCKSKPTEQIVAVQKI
jgi:hypothetical protein